MEDREIVALYWQRSESAIAETDRKYGPFCCRVARNILTTPEDAEECVNDTWQRAWDAIPPERPQSLRAWLGRVVRNLALNRYARDHAQKRFSGMDQLLSELEDCIPSPETVERTLEARELTAFLEEWLQTLPREDRTLFVRRYWHGEPVKTLARERGVAAGRLARRLFDLRQKLRKALEQEGVTL